MELPTIISLTEVHKCLFVFRNFSPIVVPLQSSMTVTLPSGAGSHHDHNPFPGSMACIIGFEDTVITNLFKTCHSIVLLCVQLSIVTTFPCRE